MGFFDLLKNKVKNDPERSPGWEAIDKALNDIYTNQEPNHYAPEVPANLGGSDPLDDVSIYFDSK